MKSKIHLIIYRIVKITWNWFIQEKYVKEIGVYTTKLYLAILEYEMGLIKIERAARI